MWSSPRRYDKQLHILRPKAGKAKQGFNFDKNTSLTAINILICQFGQKSHHPECSNVFLATRNVLRVTCIGVGVQRLCGLRKYLRNRRIVKTTFHNVIATNHLRKWVNGSGGMEGKRFLLWFLALHVCHYPRDKIPARLWTITSNDK